ncbi:MAG: glycosyltransferase family 39 protein [Bacteroidales bacterium]|jgi:tetratricopeptide (TPR) repeat protein|nr:glycosyltransferase family 39 protein [Bacteroidales bacterium]
MKKRIAVKPKWTLLLFIIIVFILYGKTIGHQFNIDDNYVVHNHKLVEKGIKGIPEIFTSRYHNERNLYFGYRPLTVAVFAIETTIFGENPHVHHFINILLYALLIIVLFRLMKKLFPEISPNFLLISLLIFTVHPIHTEVVSSLKNREEIFCFLFAALSWMQMLKFYDSKKWTHFVFSLALLGLAFLSKETAVIFVAIIPLSLFYFRTKPAPETNPSNKTPRFPWIISLQIFLLISIIWSPEFIDAFINRIVLVVGASLSIIALSWWITKFKQSGKPDIKNPFLLGFIVLFVAAIVSPLFMISMGKPLITLALISIIIYTILHQHPNILSSIRLRTKTIPKSYFYLAGISLIAALLIALLHYIPDMILPKQNAPVFHWQNPLFEDKSFITKFGVVFYSLGFYLKLLFIPTPLRFYYGYAVIPDVGLANVVVILSVLIHIALIYIMYKGIKKRTILSFAIAMYFIAIMPFSNIFFPLTGIIAERLLFIPSFAFALAITLVIFRISKTKINSKFKLTKQPATLALSMLLIIPFSILTIQRVPDWENRETLYQADMPKLKASAKANNLYANHMIAKVYEGMKRGVPLQQMDEIIQLSIKHFNQTLSIDSTYANSYHNLGYIYMIIGRDYKTAETYFTKCIQADSSIPEAYMNRGVSRYHLGKLQAAKNDLETSNAFRMESELGKTFYYLGQVYEQLHDTIQAIQAYDSAFYYNPDQKRILEKQVNLAKVQQNWNDALFYQEKITQFANPKNDEVWVDKGNFELMLGDTTAAIRSWEKAFQIFPGNYNIGISLSNYYQEKGDTEKALYYKDKALRHKVN